MISRGWLLCVAAVLLAACGMGRDPKLDAEVRSVFDQLRHRQDAALAARLDPALRTPAAMQSVAALQRTIPAGEPTARKVVATTIVHSADRRETVAALDEYDYADRSLLVATRMHRTPSTAWQVQAVQLQTATASDLAINALTLRGKPWWQVLFLVFALASPLLMVAAVVKVLRKPGLPGKWLWALVALGGLGTLSMNWTTGQIGWQLANLNLIGFGLARGPSAFSQWVISATLPVGAILILAGVLPWRPRRTPAADDPSKAGL